jgi:hypothetical protein
MQSGLALSTDLVSSGSEQTVSLRSLLVSEQGAMTNGLETQAFRRELSSAVLLKGVGGTCEGGIGTGDGSLVAEFRSDVGTLKWSKEELGGTESEMAGSTALAQNREFDAAEGSEDDTTGGAVSVKQGMTTGRTGLELRLSGERSLVERGAHGLASSVKNERFDGLNGGTCGQVDAQGYCKAHEKSSW